MTVPMLDAHNDGTCICSLTIDSREAGFYPSSIDKLKASASRKIPRPSDSITVIVPSNTWALSTVPIALPRYLRNGWRQRFDLANDRGVDNMVVWMNN